MFSSFVRKAVFAATFAAAASLPALANTVAVSLINAGSPTDVASSVTVDGVTKHNVYIGPYTLSINGQNTLAMCIDFFADSNIGDKWTATATPVTGNLATTYKPADSLEYMEDAYLFSKITQPGISSAARTGLQEAAWDIMAYDITSASYKKLLGDNSYIDAALANYSSMSNTDIEIISDIQQGCEQEFLVDPVAATPEPSSLVLMLAPAMLLGYLGLRRSKASLVPSF